MREVMEVLEKRTHHNSRANLYLLSTPHASRLTPHTRSATPHPRSLSKGDLGNHESILR